MYVAKDKSGTVKLYDLKPVRTLGYWASQGQTFRLFKNDFTELKWEDEPMKVVLVSENFLNRRAS
jgi:hypothetical protein